MYNRLISYSIPFLTLTSRWDSKPLDQIRFPSETDNIAKPLRMALDSQVIQTKFQYADRELVEQITEKIRICSILLGIPAIRKTHG